MCLGRLDAGVTSGKSVVTLYVCIPEDILVVCCKYEGINKVLHLTKFGFDRGFLNDIACFRQSH